MDRGDLPAAGNVPGVGSPHHLPGKGAAQHTFDVQTTLVAAARTV